METFTPLEVFNVQDFLFFLQFYHNFLADVNPQNLSLPYSELFRFLKATEA